MTKVNRNAELTLLYLYSCSELCLAASMLHSLCASTFKKFAEDCTVIILAAVEIGLVSHPVVLLKVNLVTLEVSNIVASISFIYLSLLYVASVHSINKAK